MLHGLQVGSHFNFASLVCKTCKCMCQGNDVKEKIEFMKWERPTLGVIDLWIN